MTTATRTFEYSVRDQRGKLVGGKLEAPSEAALVRKLVGMGFAPISVREANKGMSREITLPGGNRVKLKDLAIMSRQFATMINSGLSLIRALAILSEQTENKALGRTLGEVRNAVEAGQSLSAALAKHPKVFPPLVINMVRAGEVGGFLDRVLLQIAANFEAEVKLRGKIKSAMTYPVVVVCLVLLILSAMLLFVVPQFQSIYTSLGAQLPLPTRILLAASNVVRHEWWLVIMVAVGAALLFRRVKKTPQGRMAVDQAKLKAPVFGSLFHRVALARMASTFGMLLRAGVPILQALEIVKDTVNNKVIAGALEDVKTSVREGESIAHPLAKHAVFPPMVVQMLAVGEETGAVDTMLGKVADFYNNEVEAAVDALTSLIEPLLIAVIGGAVGAAVIALYMPMFNIINVIK
jgi:type IV pilus assembly protein PilC